MTSPWTTGAPVPARVAALRITEDAWLSRMMERPVFLVDMGDVGALTPEDCALFTAHAGKGRLAMYYAKVDTGAVAAVRDLSRLGMHVVDVNVTLDCDPRLKGSVVIPPDDIVDDCRPHDTDDVLDIAGSCFRYSRFHVDPDVPRAIAHRIKREWVANYIRGARGEQLLVARRDERLVGFLAMMSLHEADRRIRVIDLIGVDHDRQGQGVGIALVAAFLNATTPSEVRRVITQASNVPSLRLYQRFGFRVIRTGYVLHMHV